jgi:hypothetical protein
MGRVLRGSCSEVELGVKRLSCALWPQVMKLLELRRINTAEHVARIKAEELVKQNETLMREGDHRLNEQL